MAEHRIENIEQMLDRISDAADDGKEVSIGHILETVGRRSFGPILLFTGLVTLSPISGIPGVPSLMALLVLTVAVQLLIKRDYFWMPSWVTKRKLPQDKLKTMVKWGRKPARWIDRGLKARLTFFTHNSGTYFTAVICLVIALGMPPMEFIPFSVTIAGLSLALFGLALIAHDGLVALLAIAFTGVAYGFLVYQLF